MKLKKILYTSISLLLLLFSSYSFSQENIDSDKLKSHEISFNAASGGIRISISNIYDINEDIKGIYWNNFPIYHSILEKISSGDILVNYTDKGVNFIYPLDESHIPLLSETSEMLISYTSGINIYKDVIVEDTLKGRKKGELILDGLVKAWDGLKWVWKWGVKKLTPVIKNVKFGSHARRHINKKECGFSASWWNIYNIEGKIKSNMKKLMKNGNLPDVAVRGKFPSVKYNGKTIEYKPHNIGNGNWNVGTYYCK